MYKSKHRQCHDSLVNGLDSVQDSGEGANPRLGTCVTEVGGTAERMFSSRVITTLRMNISSAHTSSNEKKVTLGNEALLAGQRGSAVF